MRTYRAFISYNRGADAALAAALASSLTRFARPWYRTRAMRVFLDRNSLPTSPMLSKAIERGLSRSEWLILLACPESAASPWVRHEVAWWLEHRSIARLIIARTGGTIAWDNAGGQDFDWAASTALSPALRGAYRAEPLWADLEAARSTRDKSVSNPAFRDAFLSVAAQIHGTSKDQLWNDERIEQRKRVAFAAGGTVALALVGLAGYNQWQVSMDRKENLASIQLGAKSFSVLERDATLAAQIALAGVALRPSGIAASALRSAVARIGGPVAPKLQLDVTGAAAIAYSPDGAQLAALARDGTLTLIDAASARVEATLGGPPHARAGALAWGAGGTIAFAWQPDGTGSAAPGAGGVRLVRVAGGTADASAAPLDLTLPVVSALAFAPDGAHLAIGHADGSARVVSVSGGATTLQMAAHRAAVTAVGFSDDARRLATGAVDGNAALWDAATAQPALRTTLPQPVVSLDFNRQGGSTLADRMLALADAAGHVRIVDAQAPPSSGPALRALTLSAVEGPGVAARFVESGRCLARARADAPVQVDATLGFEPLFELARTPQAAPLVALATASTRRFATLDARGHLALYEQPLCGDAEAVCAEADAHGLAPMPPDARARWIPDDTDFSDTVQTPPGPACRRLIDRVFRRPVAAP